MAEPSLFPRGILKGHTAPIKQLVALPNHALLGLDQEGNWFIWDLQTQALTQSGALPRDARVAGVYQHTTPLAVSGKRCWELQSGKLLCEWEQPSLPLIDASLSQDHTQLRLIQNGNTNGSDDEGEVLLNFSCVCLTSQKLLWSCQGPTTRWVGACIHQPEQRLSRFEEYSDVIQFSWETQECTRIDRWKVFAPDGEMYWDADEQGLCLERGGEAQVLMSQEQLTSSAVALISDPLACVVVEEALAEHSTTDYLKVGALVFYHLAEQTPIGVVMWDLFEVDAHSFVSLEGPSGPLFAYANEKAKDVLLCQWGTSPPPFEPFVTDTTNPKWGRWQQMVSKASQNLLETYKLHGPTYADDTLWPGFIQDDNPRLQPGWTPSVHGASETALAQLEARIGAPLPEDYRLFLSIVNGWEWFHGHPAYEVFHLLPAEEARLALEEEALLARLGPHNQGVVGQLLKTTLIIGREVGTDQLVLLDLTPPHRVYMFSPPPEMGFAERARLDRFLCKAFFREDYDVFFPDGML